MIKYIACTIIFVFGLIISIPVTALLLLMPWRGYTTIFGNAKWGRGNEHPSTPTKGYWQEYHWLVIRNPVNNLCSRLAIPLYQTNVIGNTAIIDQRESGYYYISMMGGWEFGLIILYGNRCFRVRLGWKILGNTSGFCDYVCSIAPFMHKPS